MVLRGSDFVAGDASKPIQGVLEDPHGKKYDQVRETRWKLIIPPSVFLIFGGGAIPQQPSLNEYVCWYIARLE